VWHVDKVVVKVEPKWKPKWKPVPKLKPKQTHHYVQILSDTDGAVQAEGTGSVELRW
jgi:hypothetical protein